MDWNSKSRNMPQGTSLNATTAKLVISGLGGNIHVSDLQGYYQHMEQSTSNVLLCNLDPDFSDDYRFGFNGQHKENEVAGIGNHNTALFWEYDTRLGRRWNLDPVDQVSISNYAAFKNNPIIFIDPNGDKVVNGEQIIADKMKVDAEHWENKKNEYEKANSLNDKMTRKEYLANGGKKEKWKYYQTLKEDTKTAKQKYSDQVAKAKRAADQIKTWAKTSPSVFKEVDDKEVDAIVMLDANLEENGTTTPYYNDDGVLASPRENFTDYGKPAIVLTFREGISASEPNESAFGPSYTFNHEAGHFLYIVENSQAYFLFLNNLGNKDRQNHDGHRNNDPSGRKSIEYGKYKNGPKR